MATAYAALVSLMQVIDQIQHDPRPPISLHKHQVQSLTQSAAFLQQFLEARDCNRVAFSSEADPLEMRIADAVHSVEDVIESHIVDQILGDRGQISSASLYEAVQKSMDEMEVVMKEAMDLQEKTPIYQHQLLRADSSTFADSSTSDWPEQYTTMVGFDGIFNQLLDKLTSYESRRQIISITGMGGMGKTTLAKNIYQNQLVVEHFDFRAWIKISQKYNIRKILLKVLEGDEEALGQVDEYELGNMIHKKLTGRRYFIIMDDIWDIEIWDRLRMFLPDNGNRSRIMITTRLSKLARDIDESHNMEMNILDEESSWILFSKNVFGEEECPLELQGIGKQIVEGCKGLPLSISVVGGLLAKSKPEKQYWEEIAKNLNSKVNLEDDKHCLQILYMSYDNLPLHLKPCFLYIGLFTRNDESFCPIFILVQLLVAEGLVIPISGKSLEEAAKLYVIELVERNLILIDKNDIDWDWMFRGFRVHDLLWDLCLRESQKQKFFHFVGEPSLNKIPQSMDSIRRISVAPNTPEEEILPLLESATLVRSIYWEEIERERVCSLPCSRLLRVVSGMNYKEDIFQKVNLRFIDVDHPDQWRKLSSMSCFWNLHMLIITEFESSDFLMAPYDIWMMPHLRCIIVLTPLCLQDPLSSEKECSIVLRNLYTLGAVYNLKFSEEVCKRIPHVKSLQMHYEEVEGSDVDYCLNNLGRLQQLESIDIEVRMQNQNQVLSITFPRSLLVLHLSGTCLHWNDVTTKIGCLPLLQRLFLGRDSCIGAKWETTECQFNSLKYLKIKECYDLEYWMAESSHFPRLKSLILQGLPKLKEIPSDIGHIPTLQLINLEDCCDSLYSSAQRIEEEQEELGNEDLRIVFSD